MPAPEHLRRCSCGRLCASRSGRSTHARSCRTEQARSLAFTGAIERGLTTAQRSLAESICVRLGAGSHTLTAEELAERALRAASRRACRLCPKAANASGYCAEHDDAPPPAR